MTVFSALIAAAMRHRGISSDQLFAATGVPLDFLVSSDDMPTVEEKKLLCDALRLDREYVLNLPSDFDENEIRMISRKPITPEMERMLTTAFHMSFADLDYSYDDPDIF